MKSIRPRVSPDDVGIITSTFNSPEPLAACLEGLCRQTRLPGGVYVGDDGSGPETRKVVESFSGRLPIQHIWHEDEGYRVAAIRNRALAAVREPYVITLDGDTVPHPRFVEDHCEFARPGRAVMGGRCCVTDVTDEFTFTAPGSLQLLSLFTRGRVINDSRAFTVNWPNRCRGLLKGMRLPCPRYRPASVKEAHGGNMGIWRDAMLAVNGFDEKFVGWGSEDHDLLDRMQRLGTEPWQLLFRAVCFHLDHPVNTRNVANAARMRTGRPIRCELGVDQYLGHDDHVMNGSVAYA